MIALDDGAAARILIAATAVPRRRRRQWLLRLAGELETAARRSREAAAAATRQRRHRARQDRGELALRLVVPEVDVAHALVATGALADADAGRGAIEAALQSMIADWVQAWAR